MVMRFAKLVLTVFTVAVLGRVLSPEDYGIVTMVAALVGFGSLFRDMGLSTAALRAPSLSTEQRSNLWWANTTLGAVFGIAVFLAAPLMGHFYQEPRVVPVAMALASTYLLNGMSIQYATDHAKNLRLGRLGVIELITVVISFSAALAGALHGLGYWALVLQEVVGAVTGLFLTAFSAGWLPKKYYRNVSLREFFDFGIPMFGSQFVFYISSNIDNILIGRYFTPYDLGQYGRAYQVLRTPLGQVRAPLNSAAIATLSKVYEDRDKYVSYVAKAQLVLLYFISGASVVMAANADSIIPLLLGDGWEMAAKLFAIFAVGEAISTLASAGGWLYISEGASLALMKYTIFSALVRIVLFFVAVPHGVEAVAGVYVVAALILWPISTFYCGYATKFNVKPLFLVSLRVFFVLGFVLIAGVTVKSYLHLGLISELLITVAAQFAAFALVSLIVKSVRDDVRQVYSQIRRIIGR